MRRLFRAVLVTLIASIASLFGMGDALAGSVQYTPDPTAADVIAADGKCSLREAVQAARDNVSVTDCGGPGHSDALPDVIELADGQTYALTGNVLSLSESASGPLRIQCATNCNNAARPTVQGAGNVSVFLINTGDVEIDDVQISGGHALSGGGIYNHGNLTLDNVNIHDNTATSGGGGINSNGTLNITGSSVSGNDGDSGAGIYTTGTATITTTHVDDNDAIHYGGGINASGTLDISVSTVSGNTADGGAGIQTGATLTMTTTVVADNVADTAGTGGLHLIGTSTISLSRIEGNSSAGAAGGINNSGTLTLDRSTIIGNTTTGFGGGLKVLNSTTVTSSTFVNNSATGGAGAISIASASGELTLANSTLNGNTTGGSGGAILLSGTGNTATATLTNDTIKDNTGTSAVTYSSGGSFLLKNTIVESAGTNCSGAITSLGHNLENHDQCNFHASGDIVNGNAHLKALANNGVTYAQTRALDTGSQAVDAGDNSTCAAAPVSNKDERGQTRPKNGDGNATPNICDIGAYEAPPGTNPSPTPGPTATPSPTPSPTPTHSPTPSPTHTPSSTPTHSPTPTPTSSGAPTDTPTITPTGSPSSDTPTGSSSETPTATPTETPTETPTDTPTDTPSSDTPTGSVTDSPTPTPTGIASQTPTASPTAAPVLIRGDVKCNDFVDFDDVLALLAYLAELSDPLLPGCQYAVGDEIYVGIAWDDTDCDLDVDVIDALNLVLYKAGLPPILSGSCSPIGEALPIP